MHDIKSSDLAAHWNAAYTRTDTENLGWYEASPEPSLRLIKKCKLKPNASILNVGAGATTLVDNLLKLGYENIIANDISEKALLKLKDRLSHESSKIKWIVDDLTNPQKLSELEHIDLWHDRAVLHFFNDEKDQDSYFDLVHKLVRNHGFVIIAAFNLNGATKCSGLPVFRYDCDMIKAKLGPSYNLIETFDFTFTNPSGNTREYVYTLFQKKG